MVADFRGSPRPSVTDCRQQSRTADPCQWRFLIDLGDDSWRNIFTSVDPVT